ncbi:hypothetical protein [Sphingobium sp. BS19]|uniref:hypothetical protein n=1 Tax=Sphingobium sp. BS19 TaxID=3018973 RepID=UPI0022EEBEAF|nr:hypothetical protein [Sphingobium sp. BS19]GLI97957.1 hypothetical protein Sbs19_17750 [Sphingobium sp. BS19]
MANMSPKVSGSPFIFKALVRLFAIAVTPIAGNRMTQTLYQTSKIHFLKTDKNTCP